MTDDLLHWADDAAGADAQAAAGLSPWKVLVIDDDPEVHTVTRFSLQDLRVFGRPLSLLHASSAAAARSLLRDHPDVAVVLLDVVMETAQAGLELVGFIRDELGLAECRLILRTGEPGYAPELTVIQEYDINDYRTKGELTHTRLITTVSSALRSYQQLHALAEHRRGLELIVRAAADLMQEHAIANLAEGVLTQLAALLRLPVDGIVCSQKGSPLGDDRERCYVVGATGRHAGCIAQPLETLADQRIVAAIMSSVAHRRHLFGPDYAVLYLQAAPSQEAAIFLEGGQMLETIDRRLLDVFVANIAACFRNVRLVERLLRAQEEIEAQRSFLRSVIDASPHFVFVIDRDGRVRLANESLAKRFGQTPEQMVGRVQADFVSDPQLLQALRSDDAAIAACRQERIEREIRFIGRSGEERWFHTIKVPLKDASGAVEQLIGVSIDVTDRKRAERRLLEAKERLQVTLDSIGDAVITTDAQGSIDYMNPVAESLTGWTAAEARGRPAADVFRVVHEETRVPAKDPIQRCLQDRRIVSLPGHCVLLARDGREYDINDSAAPIHRGDGGLLGVVLVFHNVTENRQLARQLAHDATHDSLTGLINRTEFERRLARAVSSAQDGGARHVLCYIDLDQFKVVNDTAGHAAGDELLKQINALLAGTFRESDTLARIGGDEFALLQENCPLERGHAVAQAALRTIRQHSFSWEGRSYQVGASIGLVPITAETQDTAELLTRADVACYTAKELGRNRVHVYQPTDTETVQRHSELLGAAGLRDALERGLFRLHYQPIVGLAGLEFRIVRYEALLRVVHEAAPGRKGELVLPAAFIPAAERFGLMGAIDRWVIRRAFQEYAQGIGTTGATLAINLSGNSLSDESLLQFIESQLAEFSFPAERACFEITETAAIQNLRPALGVMAALKRHGCQLALDDFGSGLSSFHYLKTLPVDFLKIDGSFVKDMCSSAHDEALVAAINQMSHALGLRTIAEYVESRAIVDRLCELGVDYAQGYFFGKPAPWGEAAG
ncbi:EAL domain-containing protein [Accumulibacter sp.]|jgi:diguanylate cyclase (GGDEF)-like protein/PAS domain S-box-containing protein|uniref:EAL domain-containing protein n=1 Tax=Accumulibacter sp. TaxID=2053492 RepID=UPI001AC0619A|nr:EAL domain-containing protein [Accumulibacter sp.]MBN8451708.1 EAL domain-containing protein [Accumulibacter sp.]MBO3707637.1 EAL domain-containing protein [Candidatus Accumulibacter conexus]